MVIAIIVLMTMWAIYFYLNKPKDSFVYVASETWLMIIASIVIPVLIAIVGALIFNSLNQNGL